MPRTQPVMVAAAAAWWHCATPSKIAGWLAADFERRLTSIGAELSRYFAFQRGKDQAYADSDTWVRATRLVWGESARNKPELTRDAEAAPVTG